MGRKRLSDDEKKRRGTYQPSRALTAKPGAALAEIPEPPAILGRIGAKEWYRAAAFLIERKRLNEVGLIQLERYCIAAEVWQNSAAEIQAQGAVITHSNGTQGPNPHVKVLKDASAEMRHFERAWGMIPATDAALPAPSDDDDDFDEFDI